MQPRSRLDNTRPIAVSTSYRQGQFITVNVHEIIDIVEWGVVLTFVSHFRKVTVDHAIWIGTENGEGWGRDSIYLHLQNVGNSSMGVRGQTKAQDSREPHTALATEPRGK